jgi:predicted TIM-barrel fold metal-dependent hydrolase
VGGLLRGRRGIRAAGSFREVLSAVGHVDHHAHGILRATPGTLDEFRGLFSESADARQWPHVATGVTYQRAVRVLAQHLDCEPTERAVYQRRLAADPMDYATAMLRATGAELLLVDDGYPRADVSIGWRELGRLAGCPSRPVLRIERVAEDAPGDAVDAVQAAVATARERGYAALKTIAAYRGGLDLDAPEAPARTDGDDRAHVRDVLRAALEANEATGDPLPVQVHTGFGDSDLFLPRADPGHLKPLVERFRATSFVLLHCYPFVREAGWLAHVYANVYFDLSLTIPHVSRPAAALAEALELAPVSKLLYASDAARTPELYLLAAIWWRDALAAVLPEELPAAAAEDAAHMILRENARALYRLSGQQPAELLQNG